MRRFIHALKRQKEAYPYEKDENGCPIINMTLRDDSELLSPYSVKDRPVISSDLADFLDSRTAALPHGEGLTLAIHSSCVTEEEKPIYEQAIREYYRERLCESGCELKRNTLLATTFATVGIVVLALLVIFSAYFADSIWTEVIDIVAWVFLWEATDLYFLENRSLRQECKRLRTLLSMTVKFIQT